MYMHRLLYKE